MKTLLTKTLKKCEPRHLSLITAVILTSYLQVLLIPKYSPIQGQGYYQDIMGYMKYDEILISKLRINRYDKLARKITIK